MPRLPFHETEFSMTNDELNRLRRRYAELLVKTGVNLQPGQGLLVRGELAHAPFVREVVAAAYEAGAVYVQVDWVDQPTAAAMLTHGAVDALALPAYEIARFQQYVDEKWARLSLVGDEFPEALSAVDPQDLRAWTIKRAQTLKFYTKVMMANQMQWCVAGVPTAAWATKVFPDLPEADAVDALWATIFKLVRVDQPDPVAAWGALNRQLTGVAAYLQRNGVQAVHFVDPTPGPDGKPATDLVIGLADGARWVGGSSTTPAGVVFQPNMPTEEVFTTPHSRHVEGYVRTSRPTFPMQREVRDAWFRFAAGEIVEYRAAVGQDVLEQFFTIDGARRLGEVSLVDAGSPVFQSGLLFYEILFDENAACHIAFGEAYPECIAGGNAMSREELSAAGHNFADTHVDFMIGTATMSVTGRTAEGGEVPIMRDGRFVAAVTA